MNYKKLKKMMRNAGHYNDFNKLKKEYADHYGIKLKNEKDIAGIKTRAGIRWRTCSKKPRPSKCAPNCLNHGPDWTCNL